MARKCWAFVRGTSPLRVPRNSKIPIPVTVYPHSHKGLLMANNKSLSTTVKVSPCGNAFGLELPAHVVEQLAIRAGDALEIWVSTGSITLRLSHPRKAWREDKLLNGITPDICGPDFPTAQVRNCFDPPRPPPSDGRNHVDLPPNHSAQQRRYSAPLLNRFSTSAQFTMFQNAVMYSGRRF